MYRLLIVDDEPPIAEGLADMLQQAGLPLKEIRFYFSARKALEEFHKSPFELILADIRMPEMTGLAFIEEVRRNYPYVKVIFLTGFSDFDYARKAIQLGASNYLLKPAEDEEVVDSLRTAISELDTQMEAMMALEQAKKQAKQALPAVQTELFRQLLQQGADFSEARLEEQFRFSGVPLHAAKTVQTLIVRVDDYGRRFDRGDLLLIQFAVQNMVQDLLEQRFRFLPVNLEEYSFVYLIQPDGEDGEPNREYMRERLSDAQQTIERVLGVSLSMALGPEFVHWEQWPGMYRYLHSSLKLNQNTNVLFVPYEGMEARPVPYGQLNELMSEVTAALQARSEERFAASLDAAFGAQSGGAASPEESVLRYLGITHALSNLLLLYNLSERLDPLTLDKLSHYSSHRDMEERKGFLLQLFRYIADKMSRIRENPSELLIEQVKQYIEEHLHEDLSLNLLARQKYVSPSYLSRLFHQLTGEQMTGYITRRKMDQAKLLLKDHRYRVQDVADKLGYQSANYFSKVFRKAVGISPQDFRASALSNP